MCNRFFETEFTYSWQFSSHTVVGLVGTISSPLDKLRSEISWKNAELIVVTVKKKKVHLYCGCEVLNLLLTKVTTYKKVCLSGRINDVLDCFVFLVGIFSTLQKMKLDFSKKMSKHTIHQLFNIFNVKIWQTLVICFEDGTDLKISSEI